MAPGDHYRTRANECIEAWDKVTEPERKLTLLELAQRWLRLAAQVDRTSARNCAKGDVLLDEASAVSGRAQR